MIKFRPADIEGYPEKRLQNEGKVNRMGECDDKGIDT